MPNNPAPHWRRHQSDGADAAQIIVKTFTHEPIKSEHTYFETHFIQRHTTIQQLLAPFNITFEDTNHIQITYNAIHMHQRRYVKVVGMKFQFYEANMAINMGQIQQAKNDAYTVRLTMTDSEITIPRLCRPRAVTQCINRILASPRPPTIQKCNDCQHYRRQTTIPGNQGNCALGPPEPSHDCLQQGNSHWCPAFQKAAQRTPDPPNQASI